MWRRFRPPLAVVALALFGLILLLARLQYRWLGQISEAERTERRATLAAGAREFAQDFDREITRAYLLFQSDAPLTPPADEAETARRFAARYDRWQASARFPKLVREFYAFTPETAANKTGPKLRRFDPSTRTLEPAAWPEAMRDWKNELTPATWKDSTSANTAYFVRRMPSPVWEKAPAIVIPTPTIVFGRTKSDFNVVPDMSYTLLLVDRNYVSRELLPSLAERYFGHRGDAGGLDFKVAVVSKSKPESFVFQSPSTFAPAMDAPADATAELFQVRTQDFLPLVAEVRRFSGFLTTHAAPPPGTTARFSVPDVAGGRPLSIVIQPDPAAADNAQPSGPGSKTIRTETRVTSSSTPTWALMVAHPSGSLESAIASQRRRNLAISSSVLGLLGASMGLLVLATRRAQRLAKQQMEFVAAVSHELRTPLAVIRSAADNLADGVVHDEARIKRYGELMRTEGRRLTEMVEQILEFAGIQSGQRGFVLRPVGVAALVSDILSSCSGLIEQAGLKAELDIPADLPPVLGDEPALRRVFQNLIDNAIKYGAAGGSIRVDARREGSYVAVTVADRGIGIDPVEQTRIFEPFYRAPDVVAAQMQGAGLGLSLVKRIVLAHGGRVTVKSAPREGSAFTVTLPVAEGRPLSDRVTDLSSAPDATGVQAARTS